MSPCPGLVSRCPNVPPGVPVWCPDSAGVLVSRCMCMSNVYVYAYVWVYVDVHVSVRVYVYIQDTPSLRHANIDVEDMCIYN